MREDYEENWMKAYNRLVAYVEREGHCRVPARYVEDGFKLGRWVTKQREVGEKQPPDRKKKLDTVDGWFWSGQEAKWDRATKMLEQFVARNGHANIKKYHREDGYSLGLWVMHQREYYRKGTLSKERLDYLDAIPGWIWDPREESRQRANERENVRQTRRKTRKSRKSPASNVARIAGELWDLLLGLGPVRKRFAMEYVAEGLYRRGVFSKRVEEKSKEHRQLKRALNLAIEHSRIDQPKTGYVRAVLADPKEYCPEDWDVCLLRSLGKDPVAVDGAIEDAVQWANENMGLSITRLRKNSSVKKGLLASKDRLLEQGFLVGYGGDLIMLSLKIEPWDDFFA